MFLIVLCYSVSSQSARCVYAVLHVCLIFARGVPETAEIQKMLNSYCFNVFLRFLQFCGTSIVSAVMHTFSIFSGFTWLFDASLLQCVKKLQIIKTCKITQKTFKSKFVSVFCVFPAIVPKRVISAVLLNLS